MDKRPTWMYGTAWKEEATKALVLKALDAGFTAIDTANQRKHYHEAAVGEALKAASVDRNSLYLQTKFTFRRGQDDRLPYDPKAPIRDQVTQSFERSLQHLGTDYLDSYLLHGPTFQEGLCEDDLEAWSAMEALYHSGHIKALGVSNFSASQLEDLNQFAGIKPEWVQNRCFASTGWDKSVRDLCERHGIGYQGFSLLTANRELQSLPLFTDIVSSSGLTPAQVIFQASMKMNIVPMTGTSDAQHMQEDLDCLKTPLTDQQVASLETVYSNDAL